MAARPVVIALNNTITPAVALEVRFLSVATLEASQAGTSF